MTALLQADHVVAGHPGRPRVLDGVTLHIERGTRLALLGANGSGKTTLMSVLAGSLEPASGRVLREGEPLDWSRKGLREHRRHVQMVLQDPDAQLFSADVAQDVSFGPMNLGLPVDEVRERVDQSLRLLGADHLAERATHHLSYGERKRVATAGAVAMRPDLLLLDEPTAGLDPAGVRQMREALDRQRPVAAQQAAGIQEAQDTQGKAFTQTIAVRPRKNAGAQDDAMGKGKRQHGPFQFALDARVEAARMRIGASGGDENIAWHAVGAGGAREGKLVFDIDLALRRLAARRFQGGAEAGKKHIAAHALAPVVRAVEVDGVHAQLGVLDGRRAPHEDMHFIKSIVSKQLSEQGAAGGAGRADKQGFHRLFPTRTEKFRAARRQPECSGLLHHASRL